LRACLPRAARLLEARGARSVSVFGSLSRSGSGSPSDVDLAVEGLPPREYFPALAELMSLFGAPVDLVRLEEAPPSLRERIAAEGERL
jgi:predicted nucleotidyltransferase